MHHKPRFAWTAAAPEAYVWFLSNQRKRRVRLTLYAASAINTSPRYPHLLGVNKRLWQLRLTPQVTWVRQSLSYITVAALLSLVVGGVGFVLSQTLTPVWATLYMAPSLISLSCTCLCACSLALLLPKQRRITLGVAGVSSGLLGSALIYSAQHPSRALVQGVEKAQLTLSFKATAYNHTLLAKSVYAFSKNLSLAELRPLPTGPCKPSTEVRVAYAAPYVASWGRHSGLTSTTPLSGWGHQSCQCTNRAILVRLLAAEWARQFEALRSTTSTWTAAYPLANQLQITGASQVLARGAGADKRTYQPHPNHPWAKTTLTTHPHVSFCTPVTGFGAGFALSLVQPQACWAPIKALRLENWE